MHTIIMHPTIMHYACCHHAYTAIAYMHITIMHITILHYAVCMPHYYHYACPYYYFALCMPPLWYYHYAFPIMHYYYALCTMHATIMMLPLCMPPLCMLPIIYILNRYWCILCSLYIWPSSEAQIWNMSHIPKTTRTLIEKVLSFHFPWSLACGCACMWASSTQLQSLQSCIIVQDGALAHISQLHVRWKATMYIHVHILCTCIIVLHFLCCPQHSMWLINNSQWGCSQSNTVVTIKMKKTY